MGKWIQYCPTAFAEVVLPAPAASVLCIKKSRQFQEGLRIPLTPLWFVLCCWEIFTSTKPGVFVCYFSVAGITYTDKKPVREERVYFGFPFQRVLRKKQEVGRSISPTHRKQRKQEVG